VPLAVAVDKANRNDMRMIAATLDAIVMDRPEPTVDTPQHLALDKVFDSQEVRDAIAAR